MSPEMYAVSLFDRWRRSDWEGVARLLPLNENKFGPMLSKISRKAMSEWFAQPVRDPQILNPGQLIGVCAKERTSVPGWAFGWFGTQRYAFEERIHLVFQRSAYVHRIAIDDIVKLPDYGWIAATPDFSGNRSWGKSNEVLQRLRSDPKCRLATAREQAIIDHPRGQTFAEGVTTACDILAPGAFKSTGPNRMAALQQRIRAKVKNRFAKHMILELLLDLDTIRRMAALRNVLRHAGHHDCPIAEWLSE